MQSTHLAQHTLGSGKNTRQNLTTRLKPSGNLSTKVRRLVFTAAIVYIIPIQVALSEIPARNHRMTVEQHLVYTRDSLKKQLFLNIELKKYRQNKADLTALN